MSSGRGLAPWSFSIFPLNMFAFVEICDFIDDAELPFSGY
jgi:hypothetical protein